MKVSKKTYYGLRAVLALAQAEKPISIRTIAETERLPEDYLEKILQALRRAGIVEAKKGVDGGYSLAREADQISAWEVIRELDGPIRTFAAPVKGTLPARNATHSVAGGPAESTGIPAGWPCPMPGHCQTNEVWRLLEKTIEKSLSGISIKDLSRPSAREL